MLRLSNLTSIVLEAELYSYVKRALRAGLEKYIC